MEGRQHTVHQEFRRQPLEVLDLIEQLKMLL
jgi:hypothetical protein